MKTSFLFLSCILLLTSTTFASSKVADLIPQISQGDSPETVLVKSSQGIREIYQSLNLGQVQVQTQNLVSEIRSEQIVKSESHKSSMSLSARLSLLFVGGSANYDSSSSSHIDYTQVVTTNPAQILRQESNAGRDLMKLRSQLLKIVNSKEEELVILKELGLLQASAAYQMLQDGQAVPWDDVTANMKMVSDLNFVGLQTVTHCLTLKHAATNNYDTSDESGGAKAHFLFFSVGAGGEDHEKNYYKQMAYTEKQCSSSTNTVTLTPKSSVYSVDLSLLDQKIAAWMKALALAQATQDRGILFPTWGSPYYK